jgi:hypothetical protein
MLLDPLARLRRNCMDQISTQTLLGSPSLGPAGGNYE